MTERNFRSHYYEKVGFRGVEEKKSLEILLKDDPVDISKLSTFCARFAVPAMFRPLVWKLVLGILPAHPSIHEFVMQQRLEQYSDLHHGLKVMAAIDDDTPLNLAILKMYLLGEGQLPLEEQNLPETEEHHRFITIATAVLEMHEEDMMDSYWTAMCVYRHLARIRDQLTIMPSTFRITLKREDPALYNHLSSINTLDRLPYTAWFNTMFAGVLPTSALVRIWDRVLGGATRVLVYVAVMQFLNHRHTLMAINQPDLMLQYLQKMPPDNADVLVSEAIELWEKDGSHLRPEPSIT